MTELERKALIARIFGHDYSDTLKITSAVGILRAIARDRQKDEDSLTYQDILDYTEKYNPECFRAFRECLRICQDARIHGRHWTEDNPCKQLISRQDLTTPVKFVMYEMLLTVLKLDKER